MAQKGINEQQRDEVRALLIALGYDEKIAGDMAVQVFWSDRAIADMKYKLARKGQSKKRRRRTVRAADDGEIPKP